MTDEKSYYNEVADYYDEDAKSFEQRYEENRVLQKIRHSFRTVADRHPFDNALEIGCGPGFDVCYFAERNPESKVYGIDVSPEMVRLAEDNVKENNLSNTRLATGSVEDLHYLFPDTSFDLIYVFFGGLNTVYDLSLVASQIKNISGPGTRLVLTFVNRYYITEIPLWLAKGRTDKAFERVLGRWQGYSDNRKLPSNVFSAGDIRKAFKNHFKITETRGYSIFYPAWYRAHLLDKLGSVAEKLWRFDQLISRTPFWNIGEYSLYEMVRDE